MVWAETSGVDSGLMCPTCVPGPSYHINKVSGFLPRIETVISLERKKQLFVCNWYICLHDNGYTYNKSGLYFSGNNCRAEEGSLPVSFLQTTVQTGAHPGVLLSHWQHIEVLFLRNQRQLSPATAVTTEATSSTWQWQKCSHGLDLKTSATTWAGWKKWSKFYSRWCGCILLCMLLERVFPDFLAADKSVAADTEVHRRVIVLNGNVPEKLVVPLYQTITLLRSRQKSLQWFSTRKKK